MDRTEAEKIARRDIPGLIVAALSVMPVDPPKELPQKLYDSMFASCVEGILDGTIRLTPEGRLTIKLIASTKCGINPREN